MAATLLGLLVAWRRLGGVGLVAVVGGLVLVAVVWRFAHRRSFVPVSRWALGRLRLSLVYRWRWRNTMTHTNLAIRIPMSNGDRVAFDEYFPRVRRFRTTGVVDSLRVELLPGQTPEQWAEQAEALRHAFRARAVRVRSDKRPGFVWFDVAGVTRWPGQCPRPTWTTPTNRRGPRVTGSSSVAVRTDVRGRVYANCVDGQDQFVNDRITDALSGQQPPSGPVERAADATDPTEAGCENLGPHPAGTWRADSGEPDLP